MDEVEKLELRRLQGRLLIILQAVDEVIGDNDKLFVDPIAALRKIHNEAQLGLDELRAIDGLRSME